MTSTASRRTKVDQIADLLARLAPGEVPVAVAWLSGELRQGRIGIGPAMLRRALEAPASELSVLTLAEADELFSRIAGTTGSGSTAARSELLGQLVRRATALERSFLSRLLIGELRQGAQEGVMLEAVARASGVPAADVRRAVMLSGNPGEVAVAVLGAGASAISAFTIELFRPVKPMLAQSAESVESALQRLGSASLEFKIDGARIQVHKRALEVAVFTRKLNDATAALPEIVEMVRSLPVHEVVLDGEAVALQADGRPHPFQETMRRFGRTKEVETLRRTLPLTGFFFDCLYIDGEPLIDWPGDRRFEALSRALGAESPISRRVTSDPEEAREHFRTALLAGHEGLLAKALDAPYVAGRRGRSWLKVKPSHTLDLVVLAAEWGHGRRRGWLSNLHLGARDERSGGHVMVGKTFKGMTDEMLEWQTGRLQGLERSRSGHVLFVRPELVVEVAIDGVQRSRRYEGGLALRFARVRRYREDKAPGEADTIATLRAILAGDVIV